MLIISKENFKLSTNARSAFEESATIRVMTECLVGRDVSRKLYQTMENVALLPNPPPQPKPVRAETGADGEKNQSGGDFKRTTSLDAIRTGAKGYVRSNDWVKEGQKQRANLGVLCVVSCFPPRNFPT